MNSKKEVYVIDISNLNESIQAFVYGVVLKAVNRLRSGESDFENKNSPNRVVIFMDELNKYASKDTPKNSPILKEILDVTERGRSLGMVLLELNSLEVTFMTELLVIVQIMFMGDQMQSYHQEAIDMLITLLKVC